MGNSKRSWISGIVVIAMLAVSSWMPAQAAMLSTEQLVSQQTREIQIAHAETFLARADVRQQLESWGLASEQAQSRIAKLSDAELAQLATTIDQQPAGGDVLVIVGIVFVVLLILELVGVTNVFTRI